MSIMATKIHKNNENRHLSQSNDPSIAVQELVRLELQLQTHIGAIRNASGPKLSYAAIQEENDIIKELMSQLEEKIHEWKRKAEEEMNPKEAEVLKEHMRRHHVEFTNLKDSIRKANVKVKMEREKQTMQDRQRLMDTGGFLSQQTAKSRKGQVVNEEEALKESKNVIGGLKRLRTMMATEVSAGEEILGELHDQSKVMGATVSQLDTMTFDIKKGRGWLSLLKRREVTDRLLISIALVFFCCVVFYILKVRLRITFFGYWP